MSGPEPRPPGRGSGACARPAPARRAAALAALLIAAAFGLACADAARRLGPVFDEIGHLAGGHALWVLGDHRLQPENGNLPMRLAALPGWLAGTPFPWREAAGGRADPAWRGSDTWAIGDRLLFESGRDPQEVLAAGRTMIALVGALGVVAAAAWSARLWGAAGGLLTALLLAASPSWLAHAGLMTSDATAAVMFLLATAAIWSLLQRVTLPRAVLAGLAVGALLLSKASGLLIVPVAAALAALRVARRPSLPFPGGAAGGPLARLAVVAAAAGAAAVVALAVVWAAHGFRHAAFAQPDPGAELYYGGWPHVEAEAGRPVVAFVLAARDRRWLPEAYAYGLAFVDVHGKARPSFLDGRRALLGFPDFFPRAFAYKTPEGEVALLVLALAALAAGRGGRAAALAWPLAPLAVLVAVVAGAACLSPLNIGHRHLLPVAPPLAVLAGASALWWRPRPGGDADPAARPVGRRRAWPARLAGLAVLAALAAQVTAAATIHPHHLAYFNRLAGGPAGGWRHLVDSSLDWGQGLPALAAWLAEHRRPGEVLHLSYFGTDRPDRWVPDARHLAFEPVARRRWEPFALEPGLYALGATMAQQVYTEPWPPWTGTLQAEWVERLGDVRALEAASAAGRIDAFLDERGAEAVNAGLMRFDALRFARLCAWLRARPPLARPGWAMLVWRLDADDVAGVMAGPLPPAEVR